MTSIKCGNCRKIHTSVDEVKACYLDGSRLPNLDPPATANQMAFLQKLHLERGLPAPETNLTKSKASAEITKLCNDKDRLDPGKRSADGDPSGYGDPQEERVPDGYYATNSLTGTNDLDFWLVETGSGKWAGRTFVKRVIGGRDNQRISYVTQTLALAAIRTMGPMDAAQKFAQELGRCYKCGRHLTDEISRELGIGPTCRAA